MLVQRITASDVHLMIKARNLEYSLVAPKYEKLEGVPFLNRQNVGVARKWPPTSLFLIHFAKKNHYSAQKVF